MFPKLLSVYAVTDDNVGRSDEEEAKIPFEILTSFQG